MNRAGFLALAALTLVAPARAKAQTADYKLVAASQDEVWYVDAASMKATGPVVGFDVLSVQNGFPPIGDRTPLFLVVHREVDCQAGAQRQTMLGAFDAAGQPIIARTTAEPWEPVVWDTLGSGAFDFICLGKLRVDQTQVRGATALQIARTAAAYFAARASAPQAAPAPRGP